jgi:type IV secretory pathway VirB9-like protein
VKHACSRHGRDTSTPSQIYPFSDGALYQVYAAPGEITDIALEAGEQLVARVRSPPATRSDG